jgi:hypothetical protein
MAARPGQHLLPERAPALLLVAAKSQLRAKRNADTEKVLSERIAAIDGRLKAIDGRFAKHFPEYASFSSPKPASVAEVQAQLRNDEALVVIRSR